MENFLTCPLTGKIFKDPVIAEDGITYERSAITEWIEYYDTSPETLEVIGTKLVTNNLIASIAHNINQTDQPKQPKHSNVDLIIVSQKFERLLDINKFKASELLDFDDILSEKNLFMELLICGSDNIIKHVIDHMDNLEYINSDGSRPIHYVCRYGTSDVIRYFIDKGVDLECNNSAGWRPIHVICKYCPAMISYMVFKGVNLESTNNEGCRPIHYVCKYSPNMVRYIVEKGVIINCRNRLDITPLHLVCKYGSSDAIMYLVDLYLLNDLDIGACSKTNYDFVDYIKINKVMFSGEKDHLVRKYKCLRKTLFRKLFG